jgi:hypothetical protein
MGKKKMYGYRSGARSGNVSAEVTQKELERIERLYGRLDAGEVVDEARAKDAPLHPAFEWSDSVAGERYRRIQASSLIRSVEVRRPDEPPRRSWVYDPGKEGDGHYRRTERAAKAPDARLRVLVELRKQVTEAEYSLEEFRAFCEAEGVDDEMMARLQVAVMAGQSFRSAVDALQ